MSERLCRACGAPLPAERRPGPKRKWCSERCRKSQEAIIDAIRRWAEEHGGIPPRTQDWRAVRDGYPGYPSATVVVRRIGWNEALLRAGFSLHCERRPETQEWVEAQVRAGATFTEIADELGVSPDAIRRRLRVRGLSVRELRRPGAR